jgi:hypothetical protein
VWQRLDNGDQKGRNEGGRLGLYIDWSLARASVRFCTVASRLQTSPGALLLMRAGSAGEKGLKMHTPASFTPRRAACSRLLR